MTTTGMVLGKFLPPHRGHQLLVDFARHQVDRLFVVVGTLEREPIPAALRVAWMTQLFPSCEVIHLSDENPQYPEEHPDFWDIWRDSLLRVLPVAPDLVFASEDYGWKLAEVLGARFVPADLARGAVPVSGTAIRQDPRAYWEDLPRCVRPHFLKRVCVFGPESTGKSTLSAQLAQHFETVAVPEYARWLLEAQRGELQESDLLRIAWGQWATEQAMAPNARGLLISDTDCLSTAVWSEALYGRCDPQILALADRQRFDLTLLLDVDVPWVQDGVRYLPEQRRSFFAACERALAERGRRVQVIRGDWATRRERAIAAVQRLLDTP